MSDLARHGAGTGSRLPKRDILLLPLISLGTILLLVGLAEIGSRAIWSAYAEGSCLLNDDHGGFKWKPKCDARVKLVEGSPAIYHFNECGFRSSSPCGVKPTGAIRVAALGSSNMLGYWVATDDVLPELVAAYLARACACPAEYQNLAVPKATLYDMENRLGEVIALHPDVVLLGISEDDLSSTEPTPVPIRANSPARPPLSARLSARLRSLIKTINRHSRFLAVARYYLYSNGDLYVQAMIRRGEDDRMRKPLDSIWEQRLKVADQMVAATADRLGRAGIPLIVIYVPALEEVEVIKRRSAYADLDPYNIEAKIGQIAAKDGVPFVSSLQSFARASDPTIYFFPSDGHLSATGQKQLAAAVLKYISSNRVSVLQRRFPAAAVIAGRGTLR